MASFRIIFFLWMFNYCSGIDQPTVKTSLGILSGRNSKSYNGRIFAAFEGIPFAQPPVGDLRFMEPQPVKAWSGIWNATARSICLQLLPNFALGNGYTLEGEEDCLHLNVFVPREIPDENESLDVIVHIHGGAFMMASPHFYAGPQYLMDKDVIYVSINYRLGPLGFLSTQDRTVPGNNGLRDQAVALKWIQDHIKSFGGNPNSVTITGLSAGAASVNFLMISPVSKGLFHKAMSLSGTALDPWTLQEAPLLKARQLADSVGCLLSSTKEQINCMKERPARQLIENVESFYKYAGTPFSPFAPVVDNHAKQPMLPNHPYTLLVKHLANDVPWILSVTTEEGNYPCASFFSNPEEIEERWEELLPYILDYNFTIANSLKPNIAKSIKNFYFDGEKITKENFRSLIKLCGDRHFVRGSETAARIYAKIAQSPVFFYVFGYRGQNSFSDLFSHTQENLGVSHCDDTLYFLRVPEKTNLEMSKLAKHKLSDTDEAMKNVMVNMITSFAKEGIPKVDGLEWSPVTTNEEISYLFIKGPEELRMENRKELAPTQFWHSLMLRENDNIVILKDEL